MTTGEQAAVGWLFPWGAPDAVYCTGTLEGVWLDGRAFSGVRFIDRFEVAEGRIRRQDVWNDLAEVAPRA